MFYRIKCYVFDVFSTVLEFKYLLYIISTYNISGCPIYVSRFLLY